MQTLIVGATGQIGKLVTLAMVERGEPVRALVRNPLKAGDLFGHLQRSKNLEIVADDLDTDLVLKASLRGIDQVFLSTAVVSETEKTYQRRVVQACAERGVRQLVRVSVLSASRESRGRVQRDHAYIEELIAETGVPHTSINPAIFTSTLLAYGSQIVENGAFVGSAPHARNPFIDPRDVANSAVTLLCSPDLQDLRYELTGPELLTYDDLAQALTLLIGQPISYRALSPAEHCDYLVKKGFSSSAIDIAICRDAAGEAGENARTNANIQALCGRAPRKVSLYLEEHLERFLTAAK